MTGAPSGNDAQVQALEAFIRDEDLERLEDLLSQFNLFDVLGIVGREVLHSAVLAWLLDPNGSHRLGDYFLRRFLSETVAEERRPPLLKPTLFDVDGWRLNDCQVTTEHMIDAESGRVDVFLIDETDEFVCFIENKIGSGESPGQLRKYVDAADAAHPEFKSIPVFLTPDAAEPQSAQDRDRYVPLGYSTVAELIDRALKNRGTTIGDSVGSFLNQYAATLRRHVLDTPDNVQELAARIYRKHQTAVDLIIQARQQSPVRWDVVESVMEKYRDYFSPDSSTRDIRRYFAPSLNDIGDLHTSIGWPPTDRILRFEIKHTGNAVGFFLWIGPGEKKVRERLHEISLRAEHPFRKAPGLAKSWHAIYRRERIFDPSGDPDVVRDALTRVIDDVIEKDYWPMVDAIREEFGLPPAPVS